jgi:hypothetical protein
MMRKRLTKREKLAVKKWFELSNYGRSYFCPFYNLDFGCKICLSWFPRTDKTHVCPCRDYSLKTVIRRAKEMIKFERRLP